MGVITTDHLAGISSAGACLRNHNEHPGILPLWAGELGAWTHWLLGPSFEGRSKHLNASKCHSCLPVVEQVLVCWRKSQVGRRSHESIRGGSYHAGTVPHSCRGTQQGRREGAGHQSHLLQGWACRVRQEDTGVGGSFCSEHRWDTFCVLHVHLTTFG